MNEMQRLMGEEIERLQTRVEELEAELARRPIVYIAKLPNAKKWFATVPIYDVEFEIYTREQNESP
jgi:hypothetical protein